jgi:hypothetical protein
MWVIATILVRGPMYIIELKSFGIYQARIFPIALTAVVRQIPERMSIRAHPK